MELKIVKPSTEAEKTTLTTLDTIEVNPNLVRSWKLPPFQRPLRVNNKLLEVAQSIKQDDGVIPGVLTIGVLNKERYLIDGQHRREAYLISECPVGYADVRICHFKTMAEMGEEFVKLNSRVVQMRPDDIMRGLEESYPALSRIRKRAPFVGYDQIRRGDKAPVLSMSALLRSWHGASGEVPKSGGASAAGLAAELTVQDADEVCDFLDSAFKAWGRDQSSHRLWGTVNLTICMWLWRRLILAPQNLAARNTRFTRDHFTKCLMSLAATADYSDWLLGRNSISRDNSPAYARIKAIFASRMQIETGAKCTMPAPTWAANAK